MEIFDSFFNYLSIVDDFYWGNIGVPAIFFAGLFLTLKSKGFQFKVLKRFHSNIKDLILENKKTAKVGVNPFKLYFASVGGMVGIGNIVGISTAVMIGGPGSILWMWVASICGMLLKYSEIYLGVKYRVQNNKNGYDGGSLYYLLEAFPTKTVAMGAAFMLCIYSVEVYQFLVLTDEIEATFDLNRNVVIAGLLIVTFYIVLGGVKRLSEVCSIMMPPFMLIYICVCIYIIGYNYAVLPEMLTLIVKSAFNGTAPIGGFAGSGILMAAQMGISKAVYSGDIGIGYDSIVQSETRIVNPKKQAQLAIYALFTDTLICTFSTLIVLISGAWKTMNHLQPSEVIVKILSDYMPYADLFMVALLFFAGFTTLIAYLTVGLKCASFIAPKIGKYIYVAVAIPALIFFSYFSQAMVMLIMSVSGGILVAINICGILKLRNKIEF